jgi:hypothetical protein
MGPGYRPGGTSEEDVFAVDQAWCLTRRVSWTNRNSVMRCAVSEQECEQDLMITPAGKRNIMIRTACVLTTPEQWTHKEQAYTVSDGFTCDPKADNLCTPFIAELLPSDEQVFGEAWCSEGPEKGRMFNLRCYRNREDCDRGRHEAPCILRDGNWAVDQEYAGLDKR